MADETGRSIDKQRWRGLILSVGYSTIVSTDTLKEEHRMWRDRSELPTPHSPVGTLYRHGDVLIRSIASLPARVQPLAGTTLAHGEVTGHSHRLAQVHAVQLWGQGNTLFLEVKENSATLIHEEHRSIELPRGIYQVWKQREYRPDAFVEVAD